MSLPKEQNSQVHKQGPQVDTTLESSLNGRRRCKGNVALISQANGQRCLSPYRCSYLYRVTRTR